LGVPDAAGPHILAPMTTPPDAPDQPEQAAAGGRRIVSISSAPGWGALYEREDDDEDNPFAEPRLVTLAAWALVEEEGATRLIGLVQHPPSDELPPGSFSFADEPEGFVGYSNQGLKTKPAELY
jgi:hypothetical protein